MRSFDGQYDYREGYASGEPSLTALGMSLPPEMRQLQTVVNWPGTVVSAIAERQHVEGFRLAGDQHTSSRLDGLWTANNLAEESYAAHVEALVQGRAWVTVDHNPDNPDQPVIMAESADAITADRDPRTRKITAALRLWTDASGFGDETQLAAVYLPDSITYYASQNGKWLEYDEISLDFGTVPVIPMVNRPRLRSRCRPDAWWGHSEMRDIIPITDAACRALTNLQGAQELLAVPVRFVFGAQSSDFVDAATGKALSTWQAYLGRMNALADPQAKVTQLSAAELSNFTNTIQAYAKMVSALSGVPLRYFGVSSDANPASAEAIQSDETRLVMRVNRQNTMCGSAWAQAMRIALKMSGDATVSDSTRIETVWSSPETPTFAAKAAALAQVWQAGLPIPRSYVYDVLRFTPEQRAEADAQASTDPLTQLLAGGGGAANSVGGAGPNNRQPVNGGHPGGAAPNDGQTAQAA